MSILEAIDEFAEKFGKDESEMYAYTKEAIKKCDSFALSKEYCVLTSEKEDLYCTTEEIYPVESEGPINALDSKESCFLWDNVMVNHKPFMRWMKKHNFEKKDLDSLVAYLKDGHLMIEAGFEFKGADDEEDSSSQDTLEIVKQEYEGVRLTPEQEKNPEFYYSNLEGVGKVFFDDVTHNVTTLGA